MNNTTFIYSFRNREVSRIRNSINSLLKHGVKADFVVVDYGSDDSFVKDLKALSGELPIKILRMESQGLPWNKCRAINYAVQSVKTPWIVTSDIDMIYDCDPLDYCHKNASEKDVYIMQAWFLPKNGLKRKAHFGKMEHPGGFVFQSRKAFFELGGYDERIQYWGREDWDWHDRLVKCGYLVHWLPENYKFYHVWHHSTNSSKSIPKTASFFTRKVVCENHVTPILVSNFGNPILKENRPALKILSGEVVAKEYQFTGDVGILEFREIEALLKKFKNLKLILGPRLIKRKLSFFKGIVKFTFGKLFESIGLVIEDQINDGFDIFYDLLDPLKKIGLKDYYVSQDLSYIILSL